MNVQFGPTGLIRSMAATGEGGVVASKEVLIAQIQSQAKLKIGLYALASFFVVASSLLVVFAPEGREATSSVVSEALFVIAVGCAGFGTFAFKAPFVSAHAGTDASPAAAAKAAPGRKGAGLGQLWAPPHSPSEPIASAAPRRAALAEPRASASAPAAAKVSKGPAVPLS